MTWIWITENKFDRQFVFFHSAVTVALSDALIPAEGCYYEPKKNSDHKNPSTGTLQIKVFRQSSAAVDTEYSVIQCSMNKCSRSQTMRSRWFWLQLPTLSAGELFVWRIKIEVWGWITAISLSYGDFPDTRRVHFRLDKAQKSAFHEE